LAEKPQNTKREVKIMRRKKLLRQVAAAAVALSMAVSLSAPAFAAEFDLANGGLVIKADESGITVTQGNGAASKIDDNDEIVITGSYSSANGATQTAEENRQEENQPVTLAKAPAKEETSEETSGTENAPAAEKKQEQKDTEAPADPEQKTETENKDNNSDPADEEKKEQNAPANGELNASAGEGQESKAEDEGQPKPEANASAEATASASDDASNGPRKASAYEDRMSWQEEQDSYKPGARTGIVQIINNTVKKIKVSLSNAHIDLPTAADTSARGMAAIDVQGTGNVELKFSGDNTLTGSGGSAGIQKNDEDPYGKDNTGTLTITADSRSDTLNVKVDEWALGNDNQGAAIGGRGRKTYENYGGYGTKNIVIEGNGTVNTNAQIGSGYRGGAATGIVIRGNAVVNVGKFGIGGCGFSPWDTEKPGETDVTITGNAKVTVQNGTIGSGVRREQLCGDAKINISGNAEVNVFGGDNAATIGSGEGGDANVTITGNAKVTAEQVSDWYGGGAGIGGGANGKGHVTIGGKAQVQATGSAEKDDYSRAYGAGAAIGDGGTAGESGSTVQNGKNQFTIANDIEDNAEIKMTNKGNDSSNTVTQTRRNGEWVTSGEQTPEKCDHSNPFVEITVAPTCTESGYTVSKCTRCGKETGEHTNIVAPLGHEYKNGVCIRCGAPEPQENGGSSSAAPNYTVTGAETYETSVVDGRYIIAVPSEDAALNAVLGDLRAIKAQGADVVVFRTRSRESSLVIDEMLAMGTDVTPFVLTHNGGEAQLTINGAAHNELIH
jgi:outer membrane biosynthesis protein TonB